MRIPRPIATGFTKMRPYRPSRRFLAMPAERAYVPIVAPPTTMTADDLIERRIPDKHVELVRGVLMVRELPGYTHGRITAALGFRLGAHIEETGANLVLLAETGFTRLARVYRHDGTEQIVSADEALDGEGVVPGFSCLLHSVL